MYLFQKRQLGERLSRLSRASVCKDGDVRDGRTERTRSSATVVAFVSFLFAARHHERGASE